MAKTLTEAKADLESGIAKSLGGGRLDQVELEELNKLTIHDLLSDHGLDAMMAEKVMLHAQTEEYRMRSQRQMTPGVTDDNFVTRGGFTRTHPVTESKIRSILRRVSRKRRDRT